MKSSRETRSDISRRRISVWMLGGHRAVLTHQAWKQCCSPVQSTAWAAEPALLKSDCNNPLLSVLCISLWIKHSPPAPNYSLEVSQHGCISGWLNSPVFCPKLPLTSARHSLGVGSLGSPEDEQLQSKGLELNQWCLWHWLRGKIYGGLAIAACQWKYMF